MTAHLVRLVHKAVQETGQQFFRIFDLFRIFTQDPDQTCFRFWFVEVFQVGAKRWDDTFVVVRILAEDILQVAPGRTYEGELLIDCAQIRARLLTLITTTASCTT